jgi:hypothetical protein
MSVPPVMTRPLNPSIDRGASGLILTASRPTLWTADSYGKTFCLYRKVRPTGGGIHKEY